VAKTPACTWLAPFRNLTANVVRHTPFLNNLWWLFLLAAVLGLLMAAWGAGGSLKPYAFFASLAWGTVLFMRTACECLRWQQGARALSFLGFALLMAFAFSIVQQAAAGWSVLGWLCGAVLSYSGLHGVATALAGGAQVRADHRPRRGPEARP